MKFNIELSKEELKIIGDALLDLPARASLHVINNINQQLDKQQKDKEKENAI